jgi:putative transposase
MPHTVRPRVSPHKPHHVTVRVTKRTWNLRSQRCYRPIASALATLRAGLRIVQYTVQHNHLHLIVEANDRRTMSNRLRTLLSRIARGINRVMGAHGPRFEDRYHEHILSTPSETRNALLYVAGNRAVHLARWGGDPPADDPFTSNAALIQCPRSWLLREGWTRAGPARSS